MSGADMFYVGAFVGFFAGVTVVFGAGIVGGWYAARRRDRRRPLVLPGDRIVRSRR